MNEADSGDVSRSSGNFDSDESLTNPQEHSLDKTLFEAPGFGARAHGWLSKVAGWSSHATTATDAVRLQVANALVKTISAVSNESDRDEVLRWFINARNVLADSQLSKAEVAGQLYKSINTVRVAQLAANTVAVSLRNYQSLALPLPLKVALPVTAVGTAIVGAEGAGIAAFGGAVGVPVALLLFLGTAGATSIVDAFIRDRSVRDPLTKLMLTFVEFDTARRARKEFLAAMRTEAMTPARAEVPDDLRVLLEFLRKMDPVAFEQHVMSFFEQSGHPTGLTPRSNDFGVDGYVFHPEGLIVVQCKRYAEDHTVGRPAIQQFKGVIEEQKAFRGYVVTTSHFTTEARESAAQSDRIVLVDGESLCQWHKQGFDLLQAGR
ncbi:MAG: hypothetical protein RLZZ458_109 [Planctomycetota bacterium]|jgi:hypothetical protein